MFLKPYFTELDNNKFSFSRQQSSDFAKCVANDFNPIHDIDARKFCVPGDLLFAKILTSQGLYETMEVNFNGMVGGETELSIVADHNEQLLIVDDNEKEYLSIRHSGASSQDQALIEQLIRSYVAFSGENFPHVLVPLMKDNNVMINAVRPLVMYESMSVQLDRLNLTNLTLESTDSHLEVSGKRGKVTLYFVFKDGGKRVGKGKKTMLLSGLREYEQSAVEQLINSYSERKQQFAA
ncbi:hypothetical protein GZ77_11750 [Endozoicomonas montiporae]|uniref:DUF3581 domain-containing protein n=2 Tax=Endozoicomonas montiporae TaxID=1027273 RepID=A0A081N900_9GAMM|nr:DUF3581 family protein [Endozoicomonas montiporae]AMO55152.1 hypothetical protein EZMO1_0937 [Endozoicomonas montiporae CL-33]KEQ14923.1 hypothetical protein GZ77_11750 [Endozoicomonas montiporae]